MEQAEARGALVLPPPARDAPMPYDYWYIRENTVPEYHRLPSRNEQRAALAKAARYRALLEINEQRAARYLRGESQDGPPIRIRGQVNTVSLLSRFPQFANAFFLAFYYLIVRLEFVLDINSQLIRRKIFNVSHGSSNIETIAEIAIESPRFGWGFNDQ